MKTGKCNLCQNENVQLLSKSHIIPEFFHFGLKDDNNKYNLIMPDKFVAGRRQHIKNPSGALYESDILCQKCDNEIISAYETGLSSMLIENSNKNLIEEVYTDSEKKQYRIYKNIEYSKFKLGMLSILWRSAISSLEFFKEVNLNPDNLENLRLMLLNNDAGRIQDYPMITYLFDKTDEKDVIVNPRFIDGKQQQFCKFILNGYMILFIIGMLENTKNLLKNIPNRSGELHLPIRDKDYMKNYTKNIIEKTKLKLAHKK